MPRFLLTLTILFFLTLTLLATLAIMLGATQPQNPELADFGFCSGAPCYMGIDLQAVDLFTANDLLLAHGYHGNIISGVYHSVDNGCDLWVEADEDDRDVIRSLRLLNCHDLRLGDIFDIFGRPDRTAVVSTCHWVLEYSEHVFISVDGQISPNSGYVTLMPDQLIIGFLFKRGSGSYANGAQWHGFAPLWRYRQLEPQSSLAENCN